MNIHIVYSIIALIAACACGFITIPVVLDFCKKNGIYNQTKGRFTRTRCHDWEE